MEKPTRNSIVEEFAASLPDDIIKRAEQTQILSDGTVEAVLVYQLHEAAWVYSLHHFSHPEDASYSKAVFLASFPNLVPETDDMKPFEVLVQGINHCSEVLNKLTNELGVKVTYLADMRGSKKQSAFFHPETIRTALKAFNGLNMLFIYLTKGAYGPYVINAQFQRFLGPTYRLEVLSDMTNDPGDRTSMMMRGFLRRSDTVDAPSDLLNGVHEVTSIAKGRDFGGFEGDEDLNIES